MLIASRAGTKPAQGSMLHGAGIAKISSQNMRKQQKVSKTLRRWQRSIVTMRVTNHSVEVWASKDFQPSR